MFTIDAPRALRVREHLPHRRLRDDELRADVEVEEVVQMRLAHLDERLGKVAARVVHQHVERIERGDQRGDGGGVGDVARRRVRAAAGGADLRGDGVELRPAACDQVDRRACGGERSRARPPEAAPGAGDQRDAAVERAH